MLRVNGNGRSQGLGPFTAVGGESSANESITKMKTLRSCSKALNCSPSKQCLTSDTKDHHHGHVDFFFSNLVH